MQPAVNSTMRLKLSPCNLGHCGNNEIDNINRPQIKTHRNIY